MAELAALPRVRLVGGDACDPALTSATGRDEDNIVISLIAKRQFEVRRGAGVIETAITEQSRTAGR